MRVQVSSLALRGTLFLRMHSRENEFIVRMGWCSLLISKNV